MKTCAWLLGLLLLGLPVAADEIVLKDGKKIAWTSIKDLGETYEVDTAGVKTTVRKADVDRITTVVGKEAAPLTGASFTFEKKKKLTITNLLAGLDLKKAIFQGNWSLKGAELAGSAGADANARLVFPGQVPEEYDLALEIARKGGDGDFLIGLVADGKQGLFALDAAGCTVSGFCLNGRALDASSGVPGRFFTGAAARSVVCMVRKTGIVVQVDGKDFLSCPAADFPKLVVGPVHAVPSQDSLFFVCWKGSYSVTKAVLSTPKAQP